MDDTFYPFVAHDNYPHSSADLGQDIVACNLIEQNFDFLHYQSFDDPMDIETPYCQSIMDDQKFSRDVCFWAYALIGRLLFPVNHLDTWQVFPFFKGVAGTGKSTLLRLSALFFNVNDIGILSNEGRQEFGLQHIRNKYLFLCMDADKKMKLSQTAWNTMVSGEQMAIDIKYGEAEEIMWEVSGAFAGNDYPGWKDAGSSASRRFITFLFSEVITNVNPKLFDQCQTELAVFMAKCVKCYHLARRRYGQCGIWTKHILPEFFHVNRRKLQASTNSLMYFLSIKEKCIIGQLEHCSFQEFREAYQTFCRTENISIKKLSEVEDTATAFKMYKVSIIKPPTGSDPVNYDGYKTKYMKGVKIIR